MSTSITDRFAIAVLLLSILSASRVALAQEAAAQTFNEESRGVQESDANIHAGS